MGIAKDPAAARPPRHPEAQPKDLAVKNPIKQFRQD
jgi:hypothetical protein